VGTNEREKEETVYLLFVDLLHECEGDNYYNMPCLIYIDICMSYLDNEEILISLEDILSFFTGSDRQPPCGFPYPAELYFNHDGVLPTSSTCALTLTLPTKHHNDPTLFRENMILALKHAHLGRK
jgi:hypothetical protein